DARGTFLAAVAAGPVYQLLGKRGLESADQPPIGTGVIDGDIAWRQHFGGHTSGPNWPAFLRFASRYFGSTATIAMTATTMPTAGGPHAGRADEPAPRDADPVWAQKHD